MKTKNFGRKFTAFLAAVVITAGAITTGTVLLLRSNNKATEKPAAALTPQSLIKSVADLQSNPETEHFFPTSNYTAPYEYYIEFGEYPQTHLANANLVNKLNTTGIKTGRQYLVNGIPAPTTIVGQSTVISTWTETFLDEYALNGIKYVLMPTSISFGNMSTGIGVNASSTNIWFKVEPLRWFVTNYDEVAAGTATAIKLLAVNTVIGGIPLHDRISDNGYSTYEDSGVRAFLNGYTDTIFNVGSPTMTIPADKGFLQTAFNKTARDLINPVTIENNIDYPSFNDVNDADTIDKIYIPSYSDMMTSPFSTSVLTDDKRKSKPTDFAIANGTTLESYSGVGYWRLRSASSATRAYRVDYGGQVYDAYTYQGEHGYSEGLRPMMEISVAGLANVASVDALTRTQLTYTYDLNGAEGTPPAGGVTTICNMVPLDMLPEDVIPPANYYFAGWGINDPVNVTRVPGEGVIITCNTTIYAIWEPTSYGITYNLNSGSWKNGNPLPSYNTINGAVPLPTSNDVIRDGFVFLRWHEGNNINGAVVTAIQQNESGVKTYFAEWGHTTEAYNTIVTARNNLQTEINRLNNVVIKGLTDDIDDLATRLGDKTKELTDKIKEYNDLSQDYAQDTAAWATLKESMEADIATLGEDITELEDTKKDLEGKVTTWTNAANGLQVQLDDKTTELAEYKLEHDDDLEEGYEEGYKAYVNEYAFVTWKILQDNETIGGPLTVYAQYGESVNTPYGTQIQELDLPTALQTVQSKQYTYTFSHWSLTPQVGETKNPEADFPKSPAAAHVVYYAQYTRVERIYDIKWIIPVITGGQLNYNISPEQEEITELKYGTVITTIPEAPELLYSDVIYIFAGWSTTPGGTKITNFGTVTGERTFYARYTIQPTV